MNPVDQQTTPVADRQQDQVQKRTGTFIKGAAIMGMAAIIIKVMGAVFRIPLANIIGADGMGYYQTAYPVYNFLLVISTAGIPTAIAKIVASKMAIGDVEGADRVFKVTFRTMAVIGLFFSVSVLFGAGPVVGFLNNAKAFYSLIAIAPALFFVTLMSVYRGYFQGCQHMEAYAASQIAEQFGRVIIGYTLALMLLKMGREYASAGATLGASFGSFTGLCVLLFLFKKYRSKNKFVHSGAHAFEGTREILKNVFLIAIPITIGASVIPVMSLMDLGIVMKQLVHIGFSPEQANGLYGQLTGFAQTVVNFPQVLTAAIQISIVPAIAHFVALNDKDNRDHTIQTGLRIALIIGLPCAVGLSSLSEGLMRLLYPMQKAIASSTGSILFVLGFGIVFLSMYQVTTGILQGIGKPLLPAINMIGGAAVKLILTYILVSIPSLNVKGAAIATVLAFATAAVLNHISMVKYAGVHLNYKEIFLKPILAVSVMGFVLYGYMHILGGSALKTVVGILLAMVVYVVMLFVTNAITEQDLALMPGGHKLGKLARLFKRF